MADLGGGVSPRCPGGHHIITGSLKAEAAGGTGPVHTRKACRAIAGFGGRGVPRPRRLGGLRRREEGRTQIIPWDLQKGWPLGTAQPRPGSRFLASDPRSHHGLCFTQLSVLVATTGRYCSVSGKWKQSSLVKQLLVSCLK